MKRRIVIKFFGHEAYLQNLFSDIDGEDMRTAWFKRRGGICLNVLEAGF